jgi:type IV pilus assembly protein PilN
MEGSDWLEEPNLDAVRAAPDYGDQATTFNLTVNVQLPTQEEEL